MKKVFLTIVFAMVISTYGFQNADNYVLVGQLYLTNSHASNERIKGPVQELKQNNFWAKEENGKIVRGNIITPEDRKTTPFGYGFLEQYNPSGTIKRCESFNEKNEVTDYCIVEAEGKKIFKAEYFYRDTVRFYTQNTYSGNNLIRAKLFNNQNDTLLMSVEYEYDKNDNCTKFQRFNYKNTPGTYSEYSYTNKGVLEHSKNYSADGKMTALWDYTINDKGELIAQHQENFVNGVIIDYTFKYEYDKKGNWIKMVFYKDNKPFILREREIKYYD